MLSAQQIPLGRTFGAGPPAYAKLISLRKPNAPAQSFAQVDAHSEQGWIRMRNGQDTVIASIKGGQVQMPFKSLAASNQPH